MHIVRQHRLLCILGGFSRHFNLLYRDCTSLTPFSYGFICQAPRLIQIAKAHILTVLQNSAPSRFCPGLQNSLAIHIRPCYTCTVIE